MSTKTKAYRMKLKIPVCPIDSSSTSSVSVRGKIIEIINGRKNTIATVANACNPELFENIPTE